MGTILKSVLCLSLFLMEILLSGGLQAAEEYPVKPINFVIAIEAGGDADILTRTLAQKASAILGKPIMIINKPGAGSSLGYREIHDAKPDGYTIGWGGIPLIIGRLQGIIPWDYHEFTPIGMYYTMYLNVFGSTAKKQSFKSIQEVISYAKAHPGEVSIATAAVGNVNWIGAMAFQEGTGLKFNIIPQAGAGAFVTAQVAGGHTDLGITPLPAMKSQIDAGKVRFLGILGAQRFPAYKDVPTLKELGYDIQIEACGFVMGPSKMPKEVVEKLAKAFETAANDPEYQTFILGRFVTPFYLPPEKIIPYLDKRRQETWNIMNKAGILKEK